MSNKTREIWEVIESQFIAGDASLRVLAELHEVDYSYLRIKAGKDEWTRKRAEYREANLRASEAQIKAAAQITRKDFDAKTIRACEVASAHAAVLLTQHGKAINDGNAKQQLTSKEIRDLVGIVADSQAVMYRTLDIPLPSKVTIDDTREKSPAESLDDEIALAIDGLMIGAETEKPGNGKGGNGNGESEGMVNDAD